MDIAVKFLLSNIANFIWGVAAFVGFILILLRFGVGPVMAMLVGREEKIRKELADSAATLAKAEAIRSELEVQQRGAEAKMSALIAEARRDAEALKARMLDQGRTELDAMRGRALSEIEAARNAAVVGLRTEIAEIATDIAGRIIRQRLDASLQEQMVGTAVEAYESSRRQGGKVGG